MQKDRAKLFDLIDGYEVPEGHRNEKGEPITGESFFSRSLSGSMAGKKGLASNKFFDMLRLLAKRFLHTSARVYGTIFLVFGALATVIALAFDYFGMGVGTDTAITAGLILALFGIIFTFVESPIGAFAENFALTDYLFFEFFCIKRMQKNRDKDIRGFSPAFGIFAGVILAALGAAVHPWRVILALCLLLFAALSFASPEFSFLFTILVLPYTEFLADPTYVLAALLITTFISFLRKVIAGKRVYVFEKYDLLIGLMIIFVLISGIFIKGMESFQNSVMLVLGALGYIMASNLVTNRRLADRVSGAVAFSSLFASLYVIIGFAINAFRGSYSYSGVGFYSTSVFGAFIIVAALLTTSLLKEAKRPAERAVYIFILVLQAAALACTRGIFAAVALALGFICYLLLKAKKVSGIFVLLLIAAVYSVFLLPDAVLSHKAFSLIIGKDAGELTELWRASFKMFREHPMLGVGMGAEAFSEEIVRYGAPAYENGSNIFLEIACEAGIFALLFFVMVLLTCLRHRSRYRPYVKESQVRTVSGTAMIALVCLLIYGTFNYIWAHSGVCYLFWCIFGLGSATLRIAKREYDDRIIYYNDVVSSESSDIDVQIDGFDTSI